MPDRSRNVHARRFLLKQCPKWRKEIDKYDQFSFLLVVRVGTTMIRGGKVETMWYGDRDLVDEVVDETELMPFEPLVPVVSSADTAFELPVEEYMLPGAADWINADLSINNLRTFREKCEKVHQLIKFAWWSEYKHDPEGQIGHIYKYVKEHPDKLFPWWNSQFPDIEFDTKTVGRKKNADRLIPYLHRRYVEMDPAVLRDNDAVENDTGSEAIDNGDVEQNPQEGLCDNDTGSEAMDHDEEPHGAEVSNVAPVVSTHDINLLQSLLHPDDPIHHYNIEAPEVYTMALEQIREKRSREDIYTSHGMKLSNSWREWYRTTGDATWTCLSQHHIAFHESRPPPPKKAKRTGRQRQTQQQQRQTQQPRQSSRARKVSSLLAGSVTDVATSTVVRTNHRNVKRR